MMKLIAIVAVALCALAISAQAADVPINWREETYEPLTVAPGDTVTFSWVGNHGVVKIPSGECPPTFTEKDSVILAPDAVGGTYVWTAKEPGVHWVSCPVGDHCKEGQLLKITVA